MNNIHSNIKFTYELEENGKMPFLDVFIEKRNQSFISSVYRKKTNISEKSYSFQVQDKHHQMLN